jgi:hypothetical protein
MESTQLLLDGTKLRQAVALLDAALSECAAEPDNPLRQAALAKAFERAFEYVWKHLKREADHAGLEAYSPRRTEIRCPAQDDR